ncbi:hypothetical protein KDA23_06090, partial [Candidatus Saccharibacteria bacterium]|nr:hypothetical protein [Candidatus Saccharibacteria bacterium]
AGEAMKPKLFHRTVATPLTCCHCRKAKTYRRVYVQDGKVETSTPICDTCRRDHVLVADAGAKLRLIPKENAIIAQMELFNPTPATA